MMTMLHISTTCIHIIMHVHVRMYAQYTFGIYFSCKMKLHCIHSSHLLLSTVRAARLVSVNISLKPSSLIDAVHV